jgi:hypothetical protein
VDVPPIGMWSDRRWDTDTSGFMRKLKTGLRPARVGLFLNSIDDGPEFKPFADQAKLAGVLDSVAALGVQADLTAWIWPSERYVSDLLAYVSPSMACHASVRLDADCESAWASGRFTDRQRVKAADLLFVQISPSRVSVNDYASVQNDTRELLRPAVRRRPQAYSVSYVTRAGGRVVTGPGSTYYPGETQAWAMSPSRWGDAGAGPLDIGLSCYKSPVVGFTERTQIEAQVRSALWFQPEELWFWSYQTTPAWLDAICRIQA